MRSRFDEQLSLLNRELIQMGALCEEAISLAARALAEGDKALAEKVGHRRRRSTRWSGTSRPCA